MRYTVEEDLGLCGAIPRVITDNGKAIDIYDVAARLNELEARVRELETPDLTWDADDPEDELHEIEDYFHEFVGEEDCVAPVLCAKRLPNRYYPGVWCPEKKEHIILDHATTMPKAMEMIAKHRAGRKCGDE
jgi:hypothetical protein